MESTIAPNPYQHGLYLDDRELELIYGYRRAAWPLTDDQAELLDSPQFADLVASVLAGVMAGVRASTGESAGLSTRAFSRLLDTTPEIPGDPEATAAIVRLRDDLDYLIERIARLSRSDAPDRAAFARAVCYLNQAADE